ncbi:RNA polymerase primary sigma factor [Limnobacter thiooxidans]|nr:RNA polymerase primary sigma factor [Limnobacter thiooxidans]
MAHAMRHGCKETIELLRATGVSVITDSQLLYPAVVTNQPDTPYLVANEKMVAFRSEIADLQVPTLTPSSTDSGVEENIAGLVNPLIEPSALNSDSSCKTPAPPSSTCAANEVLLFDDEPLQDIFSDDWEAEKEVSVPEGDETVVRGSRQVHESIGRHNAINRDENWDDIDLFLPSRSTPLSLDQSNDSFRNLLLFALHEGCVSEEAIIDAGLNSDGSRNKEAERLLTFVAGELGATVVDWIGLSGPYQIEPTTAEEHILLEATQFFEELASGRNDPFRFYLKEIREDLLGAEDEIRLAREMEEAGREAMSALAQWPVGLSVIFDAATRVARREADAGYFCSGHESSSEVESPLIPIIDDVDEEDENTGMNEEALFFVNTVADIERMKSDTSKVTESLVKLCLTRAFLTELQEKANTSGISQQFISALNRQAKARDRMILANLRLALSIAKKYLWSEMPFDDLVQEANVGLMKAVDRYDWRKGFRFSTYATWWIRQKITRSIADNGRVVRAPVHIQETSRTLLRERSAVEAGLGRPESEYETSRRIGMSISKTRLILSVFDEVESLDEVDPATGFSRIEGLTDLLTPNPAEAAELSSLRSTLLSLLDELDERSREVLLLRFGLMRDEAMTLEEVGQHYSVTRERIRQIESKAMRKLSHRIKRGILWPFMGDEFAPKENREPSLTDKQSNTETKSDLNPISERESVETETETSNNFEQPESPHIAIPKSDLVEQALKLGLKVDDRRKDGGRLSILVPYVSTPKIRAFGRKLLDSGFQRNRNDIFEI